MPHPFKGTAIVTIATHGFVVMVADTLGYSDRYGTPIPRVDPFRKVFPWSNHVLVGSCGMLLEPRQRHTIGFTHEGRPIPIWFEYNFDEWISVIHQERGDPGTSSAEAAAYIFSKARETFQRAEPIAKAGCWRGDNPGNPIVIYVVAGFSKDFSEFGIYECRVNLNTEGNGFEYVAPVDHADKIWLTGQVERIQRARSKEEPEYSLLGRFRDGCLAQVKEVFSNTDSEVIEWVAFAVGCVRVQSHFTPKTVGSSVTIIVVEKSSGGVVEASL